MDISWVRIILDVTIEASTSSAGPIWRFVVINPWPTMQKAEKDVMGRSDYDSHVPAPNHEIAGLRLRDSLKLFDSDVEIGGTRVGVGKTSSFVDGVN